MNADKRCNAPAVAVSLVGCFRACADHRSDDGTPVPYTPESDSFLANPADRGRCDGDPWTPEVVLLDDLKARGKYCPMCRRFAVVPLTLKQRRKQPDNTTHVCHPVIGGCNQGFGR